MKWKWVLGIAAAAVLSILIACFAVLWSFDFNRLKPHLIQLVKQETGRTLEIRGRMDLRLSLRPSLVMDEVVFQNAASGSSPEMIRIKRLEAKVLLLPLLSKEIQITRLVLLEPDVLIERDKSGKWNVEFDKPGDVPQKDPSPQGFALPKLGFHQVQIEKGRVTYRDSEKKSPCCLSIDRFTASSETSENPIVLAFSGSYNDKSIEVRGTVGSLLLLREPSKAYPVDLTVKAAGAEGRVAGTIQDVLHMEGIALKVGAEVPSTTQVTAFFGETLRSEFGPLQTSAILSGGADQRYRISELRVVSKTGDATGTLTVDLGGSRPKLSGSLNSRNVNAAPFLNGGKKSPRAKTEPGARNNRVFPNDPLPLDLLNTIDAQVQFSADQVQLPQLPLANLNLEASLKDGNLVLKPIRVKAAGGDAEGQVELMSQGRAAVVKAGFKITQMDLRQVSADLKAEGKVDADLDILSKGSSIVGFMAGLNGRTVVVLGQGRVDNNTIQLLGGDLASGLVKLFNPSSKADHQTEITCAVSGFDIKDGMAKVTALVVDTPDMTVIGEGQVNLRDETLDLALKPYGKGGAAGLGLSLGELAKSFRLGGTLANPSLEIDAAQTMLTAGKAAGGVLLFGPAGIAAALAGQSPADGNPCATALEAAKKGMRSRESGKGEKPQRASEENGFSGKLKGMGESVKKLFSGQGTPPPSDQRSSGPLGGGGP